MAFSAISLRRRASCSRSSAVAAAMANGPPEPMAATFSSGSMTSPLPLTMIRIVRCRPPAAALPGGAARDRCAIPWPARPPSASRLPLNCSSLASKRANSANASAVEPANPATILLVIKAAELLRGRLQHLVPERHLAVARHHDFAIPADAQDRRGTNLLSHL